MRKILAHAGRRRFRLAFGDWPSSLGACGLVLLVLVWAGGSALDAEDWPQWLGPQRDGIWRESGVLEKFPATGPRVLWRLPIGSGYSGPAVAQGRVYLMDRISAAGGPDAERVLCVSEAEGKILWQQAYPCEFKISYPAGPRTTPNVDQGKVYTLGAVGTLACWDAETGKKIWSHELTREYKAKIPMWGFAAHPLVAGDKLICLAGGEGRCVIAFNKHTGEEEWHALSAKEPGYCPPTMIEVGGRKQLIIWHPESVNSLDPDTGKLFWTQPFTANAGLTVATPRLAGSLLLVSSFYNGSLLLRLAGDGPRAAEVWRGRSDIEIKTDGLHSIITTPFVDEGYIYGVCSYGQFRCLKLETGERVWESFQPTTGQSTRWGTAFIVKNGNRFFLWNEKGDLIIARLSPQGYQEISRAHLLEPTNRDAGRRVVWSHPAFANRCLYARNDQELIRVSLAAANEP